MTREDRDFWGRVFCIAAMVIGVVIFCYTLIKIGTP